MNSLPDVPKHLTEPVPNRIEPSEEVADWMRAVFIDPQGPLFNADHSHLEHARIGVLLTNVEYTYKGKRVCGQAEEAKPTGANAWKKAQQRQQLERWFGDWFSGQLPDFLITLDAQYIDMQMQRGNPGAVCALVEHELYHCAQATDRNGMPAFDDRTGRPKWTIAPHDVEEFTGVIERYGGVTDELTRTVKAAKKAPTAEEIDIDAACGCGAAVA